MLQATSTRSSSLRQRTTLTQAWQTLRTIALAMPLTYWLELMRRALLGSAIGSVFPVASTRTVLGLLLLTTGLAIVLCSGIFRLSEHIARERGLIDRLTGS